MKSLFEKIAQRELPSFILWEDEEFIAFLDIEPMSTGHTLVVPKDNWTDYFLQLEPDKYSRLFEASRKVGLLIQEKLSPDRVLMIVEGFEVPHVHVHLIPSYQGSTLKHMTKSKATTQDLANVLKKITST